MEYMYADQPNPESYPVNTGGTTVGFNKLVNNFIKQIKQGNIHLDLTLSMDSRGALRDHGFLWRIQSSAIEQLYAKSEEMCLTDSLAAMQ